jgi:hypothetical protein
MPSIAWIRRALCLLILACVLLPLSSCTRQVYEETPRKPGESQAAHEARSVTTQVDMIYPSEMLQRGLGNFANEDLGEQMTILWLLLVYAGPAASLLLSQRAQSVVHVVAGVPSLALLAFMVALYGNARIGGVLAIAAWTVLVGLGVHALVAGWRQRRAARS